ncbi:MAG: DUF983 domain-containing protein [Pseudomonadota bacterium]
MTQAAPGAGPPPSAISTGLRCRCPACGQGPLFLGFLTVRQSCTVCGADLSGQDSGDGPVAFIILIVGAIVVGLALVVEVQSSPPVWLHLLLWLPLTLVLTLALMRPLKGVMIALQYKHRREDFSAPG